ncbi:putative aminodeoxychorismate lyase [Paraliobacillus sp. PM-2]|uniref:endolytic transglycosylase MltG n=1 Tax=Paraliobacillus sp. PM-2 TaxID=1462524 RepID=UPI00061BB227|nr:endolytic transglycosylase MltG [Paraliobacillus sp. PM-2]CQR46926.1 putative aminodeoxychorismate lyase [Paraliobacillus sp. PM-2]
MSTSDHEKNNKAEMHNNNSQNSKQEKKDRFLKRSKEASTVRKIVLSLLLLLSILIVVGGVSGYFYIKNGLEPVNPSDDTKQTVTIPLGSSTSQIASILEDDGIISNDLIYRFYVKFNNVSQFQAGDYQLSPSMSLKEITEKLQTGVVMQDPVLSVTIPEGKTLEEIADLFEQHANISANQFMEKMKDQDYIEPLIEAYPEILSDEILAEDIRYPLEGYLFAATYQFYDENPSVDMIVHDMLEKTEQVVLNYLPQIQEKKSYSVHDVLTLASLVEKEARTQKDRKRIAGVFFNRLDKDMILQTDPTVLYALGEHKERVLYKDLEVDSPYNTYQTKGLTPGPISNFGENSLKAVLDPENTSYFYFVAAPDGSVYYAETYEQHKRLVNEHLKRSK